MKIFFTLLLLAVCFLNSLNATPAHVTQAKRLLEKEALHLNSYWMQDVVEVGGSFLDTINSFEFTIQAPESLDFEMDRCVYIAMLTEWLEQLNSDKKAQKYYKNFLLTLDNIDLRFLTADFDTASDKENPLLALIFNVGEKIIYCYRDKTTGKLEPFHRETYEEAFQNLRKTMDNDP